MRAIFPMYDTPFQFANQGAPAVLGQLLPPTRFTGVNEPYRGRQAVGRCLHCARDVLGRPSRDLGDRAPVRRILDLEHLA